MKKLPLIIIIILFAFKTTFGQYHGEFDDKKVFISVGGELGAPSTTPFNITYGTSATVEIKVIERLGLTFTGEYVAYHYKGGGLYNSPTTQHPSLLPLKGGVKYYTSPGFYIQGELGSSLRSNNGEGNMLVYTLGFGFEIPVNKISNVDLSFRYENYDQNQYQTTGMRLAYRLGW